tara:strand:- start:106 stop:264 length:159 start_codon:yes stop_codon:yes gene_type:complete
MIDKLSQVGHRRVMRREELVEAREEEENGKTKRGEELIKWMREELVEWTREE